MEAYKKTTLTPEQLQIIYREWANFYNKQQKLDIASKYYDFSLKIKDDPKAFYNRSRCKRQIAQTNASLQDAKAATESNPQSQSYNLAICDALYDLNDFETVRCQIFNSSRKFSGLKLQAFYQRNDVLDDTFTFTLGDTLGTFIQENLKFIKQSFEQKIRDEKIDRRPLWKVLREQKLCDVLSVIEEEKKLISPMEVARRNLGFHVYTQTYMRRNWVDVIFFDKLRNHPSLNLHQFKWSSPQLYETTHNKYDVAIKFLKMLHARTPLYTKTLQKYPNKRLKEECNHHHLLRVQYQIHRNTHIILTKANQLRKRKQVEKLTSFIEEIMGDYIVIKARHVLPWRFEFINEVYNILALANIDKQVEPLKNDVNFKPEERFNILLKMPKWKDKEPAVFKFGDSSSYQEYIAVLEHKIKHKKFLARMEKRLYFAKHSIEKSYLLHEIARSYLRHSRFDECCIMARRGIEEAKKCNSYVWNFLGLLQICKSLAVLHKVEKIQDILQEAIGVAESLRSEKVVQYVKMLKQTIDEDAMEKKLQEEFRKTKSRQSMVSSGIKSSSIGS